MIKQYLHAFARYAGLVTVCVEWLAIILFYLLRPDQFTGQNPISYFAWYPQTQLVFSVCVTIAAISFGIFSTWHLPKYYDTPVKLFAVSMLGYAAVALVPFDPYNVTSDIIHRLLALLFAVTYYLGIYLVGKKSHDQQVRRVSYATAALSAFVLLIFFATPKGSPYIFLLESLSAMIGQAWVVWISWHSFRRAGNGRLGDSA
jgi:hypothetical protein